jgi:CheY-like chemotaxis protein
LQAEALSRIKDEFVATVSHELRNPLNAIFGWVRLLQTGQIDEGSREHALQVIERNTRAQAQLVEDLLDMSRVITGKLRLEMRELDLGAVLEEAVEGVHPTAEAKALEVDVQIDPEAPRVLGDAERLRQVAWNLLSNAIKFTPKSGRIEASVFGAGSEVQLRVRDSGVGIERGLLPHVFERFRQGETDPSWGKAGLGIGLALVRHMVEAHAGRVEAASDGPGRGATFTVWLPAIGPRAVLASTERRAPAAAREAHGGLGGVRVLVVDDDADARDLICTTLRQHGARVTPAASVRDALEVLQSTTPEIVISDIAMPYANGYDLLAQLRALPRTAGVPVVAHTASNRAEDRARALAAGFELHVGKPVDPGALVQAVASVRRTTREE